MNQTRENGKKSNFGPDFSPFGPNSSRQMFFSKNLASRVVRYHGQLSPCTISEKECGVFLPGFLVEGLHLYLYF